MATDFIPMEQCENRALYRLRSRNLTLGVYVAHEHAFRGIRTKFRSRFVDKEYHYDDGAPFGTVRPLEKLNEDLPSEITLSVAEKRAVCAACGRLVQHHPDRPTLSGPWLHEADGSKICEGRGAVASDPDAARLYAWLRTMEIKHEPDREADRASES